MGYMEDFYPEFGRRVRLARRRGHLSQEELGRLTGMNRTSITNIEAGRQRVPLHILITFATALHVEPTELLPGGPPLGLRLESIPDQHRTFVQHVLNAAGAGTPTRETHDAED
ncbi:MAG TPA: helix-turn-helix transcriptional regulator [Actinomycetes bacterium]|jgi:transcriptional regulator with XRE-family HTH domain|nr:helix-turn-helix transcriptional regulator [Actinomycetes bacterium]